MAEKGPPKSWKSHDFPERFKTTSGTNVGRKHKKKMNTVVLGHLGAARGHENVVPGGSEKMSAFLSWIRPDVSLIFAQNVMFFTCLFESLNLHANQHKLDGIKQFFRKGCMYANHMIYRVERVCATNLRTGAWPKKSSTKRMFLVCDFVVFSLFLWLQFMHRLLLIFLMENGSQNDLKIDAQIVNGRSRAARGAGRTHWDCYLVVKNESKGRTRKLPEKTLKKWPRPHRPEDVLYHQKTILELLHPPTHPPPPRRLAQGRGGDWL